MALDLAFGKRVYDWLGQHPRVYQGIRWGVCFGRERSLQELAIAATGLHEGDTVLDLAYGAGVNLAGLEAKVGESGKIIAVDYSTGMLDTARARSREHGWTNIEFRRGDAASLELPAKCLDGAICTFGLSAMPGELAALRRVAAALKPGACLVVLDAKIFTGWARILNPIAGPLFQYTTNWNYKKDVVGCIRATFDAVQVVEFNSGCNFIAVARRK
jgi:ubiquinone/menaquinone biosynthesis C-methylase UbiE